MAARKFLRYRLDSSARETRVPKSRSLFASSTRIRFLAIILSKMVGVIFLSPPQVHSVSKVLFLLKCFPSQSVSLLADHPRLRKETTPLLHSSKRLRSKRL